MDFVNISRQPFLRPRFLEYNIKSYSMTAAAISIIFFNNILT